MATKFKELKLAVIKVLDDTVNEDASSVAGRTFDAEILKDAVNAALVAVNVRTWKKSVFTVEAHATDVDVPDDFIDADAVFDNKLNAFLPHISFQVGSPLISASGNGFYMYPTGKISFLAELETGGKVFYQARFTKAEQDNQFLESPDTANPAMTFYAASYCLLGPAVSSGDIRQFNTKVDSGQPGDIPALKVSDHFLRRFGDELKRIPMMTRGRTQ